MHARRTTRPRRRAATKALKPVALKITRRRFASAALHEIHMHHRVWHAEREGRQHVSRLVEFFPHEGHVCLAFELHGRDLSHAIRRGALPLEETRQITRQLLGALAAMHAAGVIHTDVKPDNVLYDRRRRLARLADLGLAETSIPTGESASTQDFAAPEAIFGTPMTAAMDLWALGCTIYQMLTGELLFDPWTACEAKYEEFGDADDDEEDAEHVPSRKELDEDEENREQMPPGSIIAGKYRLLRQLGQGKFATVWQAEPLHQDPVPLPPAQEVLDDAKQRRAALPVLPSRKRWDLYEVAEAYEHLVQMHALLGPAPVELMDGCWKKLFCAEEGGLRFQPDVKPCSLTERLARHLPPEQAAAAADFIGCFLRYDPAKRLPAEEALQHPWLTAAA